MTDDPAPPPPPPPRDTAICRQNAEHSSDQREPLGSEVTQPSSHHHRLAATSKVFLHPISAGTSGRAATKPGGATASRRGPIGGQFLSVAFMTRPERESLISEIQEQEFRRGFIQNSGVTLTGSGCFLEWIHSTTLKWSKSLGQQSGMLPLSS